MGIMGPPRLGCVSPLRVCCVASEPLNTALCTPVPCSTIPGIHVAEREGAGARGAPGDTEPPQLVRKLLTAFAFADGLREREGPKQEGTQGPPAKHPSRPFLCDASVVVLCAVLFAEFEPPGTPMCNS